MGQSPSADLFYGYDLKDLTESGSYDDLRPAWMGGVDDDGEERPEVDADEHLASKLGWVNQPYPANGGSSNDWGNNRARMHELVADYPVELDYYGYLDGEDPGYCVRVKACVQSAGDWGSTEVAPLAVDPAWDDQLAEYMRLMELPVPSGKSPGWHMNCSYG